MRLRRAGAVRVDALASPRVRTRKLLNVFREFFPVAAAYKSAVASARGESKNRVDVGHDRVVSRYRQGRSTNRIGPSKALIGLAFFAQIR